MFFNLTSALISHCSVEKAKSKGLGNCHTGLVSDRVKSGRGDSLLKKPVRDEFIVMRQELMFLSFFTLVLACVRFEICASDRPNILPTIEFCSSELH